MGKMEVTTPVNEKVLQKKEKLSYSLAELVCDVVVFTKCGVRAARRHPKGLIISHNNARKSTKGRSDKVEINQLADTQGLQRAIKERAGFSDRLHFCASISSYF